jgi:hypothetical protein
MRRNLGGAAASMAQRSFDVAAGSIARSAVVCAAIALVIAGASSAQEKCLSPDLVRGVMGVDLGKLFVGAPEPEVAQTIPLPSDATPVGGSENERGVTLVATVARATEQVRSEMSGLLQSAGWKARVEDGQPRGGFMARQRQQDVMHCAADGAMIHYSVQERDSGTLLTVRRYGKMPGFSPCNEPPAHRGMRERGPMPALDPPPGVSAGMQGMSSGPHGSHGESVVLSSDDAPRDLATHFGAQIADQGWTLDADLMGDTMAMQMWSLTDSAGTAWRGMLTIAVLGEDTRDASFTITPRE